jgi:hypothetical protein
MSDASYKNIVYNTTLHNMGAIGFENQDWELAIPYFLQAYQILEKIGSPNAQHPLSYLNAIKEKVSGNHVSNEVNS